MVNLYSAQEYYTTHQLVLPMNVGYLIPENSPVITFNNLIQQINLGEIVESKVSHFGRPSLNQVVMLKIILYGFMTNVRTSRQIAKACKENVNFMYLLEGYNAPSHTSINNTVKRLQEKINPEDGESTTYIDLLSNVITQKIIELNEVDISTIFIDGTKFEADANKYSFVFRSRVMSSIFKLGVKINKSMDKLIEIYDSYDVKSPVRYIEYPEIYVKNKSFDYYTENRIRLMRQTMKRIVRMSKVQFVHGKGRRKSQIQKMFELLDEAYTKMKQYNMYLKIIGPNRNSFSKTDHDATFMHMKEDHMRNSQLKPGYNMQIAVADEFIVLTDVFQDRSDFGTFIPLMEKYNKLYDKYPKNPVADAGYGSFDTYSYCKIHGMNLAMKFGLYKQKRSNKHKKNKFHKDNYEVNEFNNPVCPNGVEFEYQYTRKNKNSKYNSESKVYKSKGCAGCELTKECNKKSDRDKTIHINEGLDKYQKEAIEFLDTEEGVKMRVQRSIQVEGAFGVIKEDMRYRRLNSPTMPRVKVEWTLITIGFNLMKHHNKLYRSVDIVS